MASDNTATSGLLDTAVRQDSDATEADLIERIATAELAGRETVADALARKLDKHRARQATGNVSSIEEARARRKR